MACLDEFGHTLYVFTKGDAKLYAFKYNDQNMPSILTLKGDCIDLSEQDPYITEAKVISMDYVQELQGVVITMSSGGIYLVSGDSVQEAGTLPAGILAGTLPAGIFPKVPLICPIEEVPPLLWCWCCKLMFFWDSRRLCATLV